MKISDRVEKIALLLLFMVYAFFATKTPEEMRSAFTMMVAVTVFLNQNEDK